MPRAPAARRSTASPANGSIPPRRPLRASTVTSVPKPAKAVAISTATTPPPMIASLAGGCLTLVASRLVHGFASARPTIGGTSGSEPVETTTAWRATRVTSVPSGRSTTTRRGPARRPDPRSSWMPTLSSHPTAPWSLQSETQWSRRRSTASTSSDPVTASAAPARAAPHAGRLRSGAGSSRGCTPSTSTRRRRARARRPPRRGRLRAPDPRRSRRPVRSPARRRPPRAP